MPATKEVKLAFGPNKYAAFHLLLGRWLRHCAAPGPCCYVTLGGTELRDIPSVGFIDPSLIHQVWSYENDHGRYQLAKKNAEEFQTQGISISVDHNSFWNHVRSSTLPHLFFIDLLGICAWSDLDIRFGAMLQNEIIREGDGLIITSHLGHNPGMKKIRDQFGGEFDVLGIDTTSDKVVKSTFRRSHPSMTLFKALSLNGIQSELSVRCFGAIKYRDASPMGIYGYCVSAGRTELSKLIQDESTFYFDLKSGRRCPPAEF
jgi:hypothetical protein